MIAKTYQNKGAKIMGLLDGKVAIITGLFIVDALALIGATNLGEAITFALLMLVNLLALSYAR
jgi:hypothetical protein